MRLRFLKLGISAAILVGLAVLLFPYPYKPYNEPQTPALEQRSVGVPTRLKIPGLNLEAAVEHVAIAADGSMDVPKLPFDVAWYELGARPGETGSAVIAGHLNWKGGAKAIFSDLDKLKPGDHVMVENDQGVVISFIVKRSETYDANANATDIFTSNDGKARLNLITCSGEWNKETDAYSQRLVVFTEQIPE